VLLICLSCVWVAGIFMGSRLNLPPLFCLLAIVPLLGLFFTRRHLKVILLSSLGTILFVAASVYSYASLYNIDENKVHFYNDSGSVEIRGTITGDPDVRDKSTRLTVSASSIFIDNNWREVGGSALVFVPRYPEYHYGDVLQLTGEPATPVQLGDFDYRGYLAHQGIYTTMYFPHITILGEGQGFKPLAWIYNLRSHLSQLLADILPEPQAALAQGILLGMRGNIPADLNQDFSRSGTSHLLAISGVNVGIMAGILLGVGLWLFGRKHYLYVWLALVAVWFYTVITGLNPPVVRGAIMASLFLLAEGLGRQRSAAAALTLAAAVMVGIHPYVFGDASFQLSFLAMAGLIFLYPVFRILGRNIVAKRFGEEGFFVSLANVTVDTMSATLGAIIAVWPLITYYFGLFSLVGPLATFLAMPVLPVIIATGTLTTLVGLASLSVAQTLGWLTWPFLSYMILVVKGLGSPSVSSVQVGWITPVFIICYYVVLAAAVLIYSKWQKLRNMLSGEAGLMKGGINLSFGISRNIKLIVALLLVLAVLLGYAALNMPGGDLRVSFLNVGEGDAVLIQKGSRQVLVDGGPTPQAITLELSKQMPFWDRTIDLVILTHSHQDHLAGLIEVMRRYRVQQVLYTDSDSASAAYDEWIRLIGEGGVKSTIASAGQQIDLGDGIIIEVLNPQSELITGTPSDVDNNGVALLLKDDKVSFLLVADIMSDTEWEMMRARTDLAGTVLKVAHHGSDTSTTREFLSVVNPQIAVISVGEDNKFGLPDSTIIARLEEKVGQGNVYRTDINGTINFTTDGERLWVETRK
jgi:competence protein ComEC